MGQRHQIFVKIANPAKHLHAQPAEKRELEKEFGTDEFTVLVWHHQWLFGRSALANALRLLGFAVQFTREVKTDPKAWGAYKCPFSINGMKQTFTRDEIIANLTFILNYQAKSTNRCGYW